MWVMARKEAGNVASRAGKIMRKVLRHLEALWRRLRVLPNHALVLSLSRLSVGACSRNGRALNRYKEKLPNV